MLKVNGKNVLQSSVAANYCRVPTAEFFAWEITKVMTGVLVCSAFVIWFLFNLRKRTCVLNITIQFWNYVHMFSMEVGSVRNVIIYLWASKNIAAWRYVFFGGDKTSRIFELGGYLAPPEEREVHSSFWTLSVGYHSRGLSIRGQVRNSGGGIPRVGKGCWGVSGHPPPLYENWPPYS